jgi:hypothetical protein
MTTYVVPALNAVDFALTAATPADTTNYGIALSSYSAPALNAIDFALVSYAFPDFIALDFELGDDVFPTQYAGLRYYHGTVKELCLVATADAPAGNQWLVRKGGTTYAVYLVDTGDPNASTVRIRTSAGTKAARLKT